MPAMPRHLAALAPFAALAPLVVADLGAALRRSRPLVGSAVLPAAAPLDGAFVVPLERVEAQGASFYLGTVHVGSPEQPLKVLFDTASGHVILPHRACDSTACHEHGSYSPWASATSMDVNVNGTEVSTGSRLAVGKVVRDGATMSYTQSDLGTGEVSAVLVRDSVCLEAGAVDRSRACVDLAILAALKEGDVPFRAMPNDGIVGLGLESLAIGKLSSFMSRLLEGSRNVLPQFGIFFGRHGGELHFGGHQASRFAGLLRWLPVDHPEDGYWQVAVRAVYVGEQLVDNCAEGCHGVVDTGASRLGVQASRLPQLRAALQASSQRGSQPCHGAALRFDLGEFSLSLGAEDYTDDHCGPQLGELALEEPAYHGVYAFGETVLRRYYAAFDWEQRRVGFAPLSDEPQGETTELVMV